MKNEQCIKVINLRENSKLGWGDSRTEARKCIDYINNDQFTAAEREKAEDNVKPLVTYNILVAKLNVLLGNEQLSRRGAKILPKYTNDEDIVRILSDNWEHIQECEDLEKKLALVFADGLISPTGGWARRKIKMDDMGYLEFKYDVMDNLEEVRPDPDFRRYDLMDAQYIILEDWLTKDAIIQEYGYSKFDENKKWWYDITYGMFDTEHKESSSDYRRGSKYLVCTLEERVTVPVNIIRVGNEYFKLTDKEIEELFKDEDIEYIKRDKDTRIHVTTILPEFDVVLEDKKFPFPTKRFSVFPFFSFNYNMTKSDQVSLISLLRQPQDRINKSISQRIDYITQMLGKKTWISKIEKEAIDKLQKTKGDPNAIIPLMSMKNRGQTDEDINLPPALFEEAQLEKSILYDISGINPAMEGFSERSGESGVLYQQKLGQGYTSTNPFFENLAYTRELIAKDYVELAPYVYFEDDRLLPVKRANALTYELVNLNYQGNIEKDIRNVRARVVLDDAENTPDRIQKTFEQNVALVNMLISSGAQFNDIPWDIIIKHSRFRDKEEWAKFLVMRQQMMQNAMDAQQADNETLNKLAMASSMNAMQQKPPQERDNGGNSGK